MKKLLILISIIFANHSYSQLDTIEISDKNTSYLVFPEGVDYFDIGLPNSYYAELGQGGQAAQSGNLDNKLLKLKAANPNTEMSTIMVKYGELYTQFFLKYKEIPRVYFWYFNGEHFQKKPVQEKSIFDKVKSTKADSTSHKTIEENKTSFITSKEIERIMTSGEKLSKKDSAIIIGQKYQIYKEKTDSVKKIKNEKKELGFISEFLKVAITVIRNDKENTYLKIAIKNESSLPYKFDFISFQYVQSMSKGILQTKKKAPQDVFPVVYPSMPAVPANTSVIVGYAIPSFALDNDGILRVLFRERTGDRVLKIEIPSRDIQASGYLNY